MEAEYTRHFNAFSLRKQNDIRRMFTMFDEDNSGSINRTEFCAVLESMGIDNEHAAGEESPVDILFKMVDTDGSDELDLHEFQMLMAMVLEKRSHEERKN